MEGKTIELIDDSLKEGEAPGTFRWKEVVLPTLLGETCKIGDVSKGWSDYSAKRLKGMEIIPQAIDALSFPLTIANAIHLSPFDKTEGEVNVVLMGATEKAEQRIFIGSDYFSEIQTLLPFIKKLNLYFVGPEISITLHLQCVQKTASLKAWLYKGSVLEFIKEMGIGLKPTNTIFVGLNTGLGIKHIPLMMSWAKDLKFLLKRGYLIIFTSANDYEDLVGETFVMQQVLGAKYVLEPVKNAFCGMTRYHLPGKQETCWYTNSAYIYAVKGRKEGVKELTEKEMIAKLSEYVKSYP